MSYTSDWSAPGKLCASLGMPFWGNLKPTAADITCLLSLFFDNLSTMVGVSGVFLYVVDGSGSDAAKAILYGRIIPACAVMLFFGNFYYSWMATRMKTQFGRDFCAQPYGVNTVGAFPFLFGIMGPVVWGGGTIEEAWKVGCCGNFIVGIINLVLGILLAVPVIQQAFMKYVPIAALTIPVAGVGLTWLAINQIAGNFATPVAGFLPLFFVFIGYFAKTSFKIGPITLPLILPIVIPGYILGWVYGVVPAAAAGYTYTHAGGGLWAGGAAFEGFSLLTGSAFGTVLPLAIVATFGGIMCLVGAYNAGDPYPIAETLISDGIGTLIGSLLGSPFGTVIYFGHPIHKRLGGKYFFSFANGVIWLILGLSGVMQLILEITPGIAIGPVIFIFGLMLGEECTKFLPQRHHAIIFFSLFFGLADYFGGQCSFGAGSEVAIGLTVMRKSPLLICMIWSACLVYTFDRMWRGAAVSAIIGAIFSFVGLIHQDGMDVWDKLATGSATMTGGNKLDGSTDPRYSTSPLQFALGYLLIAAVCLVLYALQKTFPDDYPQPITDGVDQDDHDALTTKRVVIGSVEDWWGAGGGEATKSESAAA